MADTEFSRPPSAAPPGETALTGGRLTPGVVRVGATVRRPVGPHSPFVHALLAHLERAGFTAAPRFLGIDDRGREILSYLHGQVPDNLDPGWTDGQLAGAARLLRRFHDATAGSPLAGAAEVVCHGDISPVNTVFAEGQPVALIDFDMARPGRRIWDVAYGLFLWLNLGWDGPPPHEQRRRMRVWCDAYGLTGGHGLLGEIKRQVRLTVRRRRGDGDGDAAAWWQAQLQWIEQHQQQLGP
jgi:hypothetical protein